MSVFQSLTPLAAMTVAWLAVQPIHAAKIDSAAYCIQRYLNETIMSGDLVSTADASRIEEIYRNPDLSPREKIERADRIVFEARLRHLPPTVAEKVRVQYETLAKIKPGSTREPHALPNGPASIPEEVFETFVISATRAHKIEHAIQMALLKEKEPKLIKNWKPRSYDIPAIRNAMETGAIGMEGISYKTIPVKLREEMIQDLKNGVLREELTERDRAFLERVLTNSFDPLPEFVDYEVRRRQSSMQVLQLEYQEKHWDSLLVGAYSKGDKIFLAGLSAAYTALGLGTLYATCWVLDSERSFTDSAFYKGCVKLGFPR